MANIIAVDDDADVRSLLTTALQRDGHIVKAFPTGSGLTAESCRWADCILLDVMMPGEDGFAACQRIRAIADCPILFLTARTEEADIIRGLGLGGDDYLMKPFRVTELRARVNAHLRRDNELPIRLTRSEYSICEHLAVHAGQTFSKEQIYEAVFGFDGTADDSAITEHIKNIRAKLRTVGCEPIETVWGVGYKWKREQQ